jgi:hypothetical protein
MRLNQPKTRHRKLTSYFGHSAQLLHGKTLRQIILKTTAKPHRGEKWWVAIWRTTQCLPTPKACVRFGTTSLISGGARFGDAVRETILFQNGWVNSSKHRSRISRILFTRIRSSNSTSRMSYRSMSTTPQKVCRFCLKLSPTFLLYGLILVCRTRITSIRYSRKLHSYSSMKTCSESDVHSCSDLRPEPHRRLRTTRYQPHSCFRPKLEKQQLWQSLRNKPIDRAVLF